jgi:5'-methylthioadenosine phosphorylase
MSGWKLGIIGGSGLYDIPGLADARWETVASPWGTPSDAALCGRLGAVELCFLPRHGRGHAIPPEAINARANIDVLKRLGCTDVLAISAVGSLAEHIAPGDFVVVDQFIDRTDGRARSFFGPGLVGHVPLADPVCPVLAGHAGAALAAVGARWHAGGCYLAMAGPSFSTRAESRLYRQWGAHVIGMTGMPEARLAREAELPYALVAMATDYDCWHDGGDVAVPEILRVMQANAATARQMVAALCAALPAERPASPIDTVLDGAIMTAPAQWDAGLLARNAAILARRLAK